MSSSNGGAPKYREYKIKSYVQPTNYHVMLMPEKGSGFYSFSDFTPPVRLYRNYKENIFSTSGTVSQDPLNSEKDGLASSNLKTKRRTQIITQFESPAQKALKAEEASPWILEDGDGKSFTSRLEGGQQQKYVLFVNQVRVFFTAKGSEFRALFVNKWYRFSPRLSSSSSTGKAEVELEDVKPSTTSRLEKMIVKKGPLEEEETEDHEEEAEGLDYDDVFDDDDDDTNEIEEPIPQAAKSTLSSAGRELKKTLQHLDKSNIYQSDDEDAEGEILEHDASSYSSDEENMPKEKTPSFAAEKIEAVSTKSSSKKIKTGEADLEAQLLSDADIIAHLKDGPMRVKDLILHLKSPLKANPVNKEIFKELIKKLCIVKLGAGDDEKWVSLKNA